MCVERYNSCGLTWFGVVGVHGLIFSEGDLKIKKGEAIIVVMFKREL